MKNLIFLFIFIVISISLKSQEYKDYIIKQSGDTIKCEITEVGNKSIIYNYLDLIKGKKTTYIKLTEVKKIVFCSEPEIIVQNGIIQKEQDSIAIINEKYRTGTVLIITGLTIIVLSAVIFISDISKIEFNPLGGNTDTDTHPDPFPKIFFSLGGISLLVGEILHKDSHKFIDSGYNNY
jgi:hypothetical protein